MRISVRGRALLAAWKQPRHLRRGQIFAENPFPSDLNTRLPVTLPGTVVAPTRGACATYRSPGRPDLQSTDDNPAPPPSPHYFSVLHRRNCVAWPPLITYDFKRLSKQLVFQEIV